MVEDQLAEVALAEREEELKIGSRALNKRVKHLEAQCLNLREGLEKAPTPLGWQVVNEIEELQEDIYAARWGLYELTAGTLGWEYNAADIALWCERAVAMGAYHPRLDHVLLLDLVHVRQVPNAPLRERYEHLLKTAPDVPTARPSRDGRRLGIAGPLVLKVHQALSKMEQDNGENYGAAGLIGDGRPQMRTLERWLGIQTNVYAKGAKPSLRLFVRYEQAEAMARAFGLSPHDAGI